MLVIVSYLLTRASYNNALSEVQRSWQPGPTAAIG